MSSAWHFYDFQKKKLITVVSPMRVAGDFPEEAPAEN